jgi:hypothetical protein
MAIRDRTGGGTMIEVERSPWLAIFDEYKRIVRDAGEMLRDADRLMAQNGFESANPQNTYGSEGSANMDAPERWVTGWFARFYKRQARPAVSPYIAVFLHDRDGVDDFPSKETRLREPLVLAGVIRSASETPCRWSYWHVKRWFWNGGKADGEAVVRTFDAGNSEGQAGYAGFGVRLERIRGLANIDELVIKPLVTLIG